MTGTYGDDGALVAALQRGDEAAYGWLLDTHSPRLHRLARSFVATPTAAEEVVQETWMAVVVGIDGFEGRSTVATWVTRILVNQARRRGARDARSVPFSALGAPGNGDEPTVDPDAFLPAGHPAAGHWASWPPDWEHEPAARLESAETLAAVRSAIDGLPPAQRQVVLLRDVEGWSAAEVCELLGVSDGNQRILLHRGRARVRRAVERHLTGGTT